jgi:phage tail sheath protein FI
MAPYLSPGVYVEEVPPLARPIAGVGTSTAGFIGVIPDTIVVPSGGDKVTNADAGKGKKDTTDYALPTGDYPVVPTQGSFEVRVNGQAVTNASLKNDDQQKASSVSFTEAPAEGAQINVDFVTQNFKLKDEGKVQLCTTFADFTKSFGDFSRDGGQQSLAHAVFGFFNNGGTRCYVVRTPKADGIAAALQRFETIDEIAIVAAPGVATVRDALADHCKKMGDRFAILESKKEDKLETLAAPRNNPYAAFYFPWIWVYDPLTDGKILVPPSGHLAGIYARVDAQRGVHKAPANEAVAGALELQYRVSKAQQDGLNPGGINCIRELNGNIYVWGARTLGGDANGTDKYVSTRRLLNFLRESIEDGTQFVVFEPNNPALWQRIKRSVGDFLLNQWRDGALFGETPDKAFFVKCDAETNPPDARERGEVITMVGVAIVKPAEFVVFKIQQQTGG